MSERAPAGPLPGEPCQPALVMDTGPLSHFAEAGWLGVLPFVANGAEIVVTDVVEEELRAGSRGRPHLEVVLGSAWLVTRRVESPEELEQYAFFAERLVGQNGRNAGEASVLAYARAHSCTAIIDDGAGRKAGLDAGVEVRGTLGLLIDAIHGGKLTLEMVSRVADDLLVTEYRLPFRAGGFADWARANGLG